MVAAKPVAEAFGVFWTSPRGVVAPCEAYAIDAAGNVIADDFASVSAAYASGRPFKTYEGYLNRADAEASAAEAGCYSVRPLPAGTLFHLRDKDETLAIVAQPAPADASGERYAAMSLVNFVAYCNAALSVSAAVGTEINTIAHCTSNTITRCTNDAVRAGVIFG